jgi:hypothetical protein
VIDLALASRIPPQAWLDAGPRAIVTAEELLDEAYGDKGKSGTGGSVMSG